MKIQQYKATNVTKVTQTENSRNPDTLEIKVPQTSHAGGRHNMHPPPCKLTFDLESGVQVACDVGYLWANFSLHRPLCSRLRPDVRDRQTDIRRASSLNVPTLGVGHNNFTIVCSVSFIQGALQALSVTCLVS